MIAVEARAGESRSGRPAVHGDVEEAVRVKGRALDHTADRLPLTRLDVATLVRVEWHSFFYSANSPSERTARLRARLEGKIARGTDGSAS